MAIDSSIAMGVKPPQIESPMNALAKVLQIREAQQGQQMNALKMDEYQRSVQSQNALRQLLGGFGADHSDNQRKLLQGGYMKEAQDYGKNQAEILKDQTAAEKDKLANAMQKLALGAQLLGSVRDQASYDQARATAQANGLDVSRMQPNYDPAFVEAKRKEGQTVAQQLEQYWKQKGYDTPDANAVLSAQTSRANNQASVGASYANAGATREVAKATRDAATIQRDQATEMKMGDDYRAQSKDFKAVGDAYKQINATLDKAATSPAATLAAATKFMKLLDPGSVVRESELGMALAASGVFDRATNYYNTLKLGKVLTPNQVKDFKNITQQIYGAAQAGQKQVDAHYTKQANAYKLRPEMIVQDLGQNEQPARTVVKTGKLNGRVVHQYSDGTTDYAD
jgi:hypothetical protein